MKEKTEHKIREIIRQTSCLTEFNWQYDEDGRIIIKSYKNCLIVEPLTPRGASILRSNPYHKKLSSKAHTFYLFGFPADVSTRKKANELPLKYKSRLDNLLEAMNLGNVQILTGLKLTPKEYLQLKYSHKKPKKQDKEENYRDDEYDTVCTKLAKEQTDYEVIERVSLTYNTVLLLHNGKENKNKALYYYKDVNSFYTDCIINYLLEHSEIISDENLSFSNPIRKVKIGVKELKKLYPNKAFTLKAPAGVEITYTNSADTPSTQKRHSKGEMATFTFSNDYLSKYKSIIKKEDENITNPNSFIRVPMFFCLQSLKANHLTSRGFKFLLWFLCFYRMEKPKLYHSPKTIIEETGISTKHSIKGAIDILNNYLSYLHHANCFKFLSEMESAPIVTKANYDKPLSKQTHPINIQKPKRPKFERVAPKKTKRKSKNKSE